MEKIELTEGKKNGTDIAKWFGISAGTFRAHKDSYLEKLKRYADYEINDSGKYIIKKVYEPYYDTERTIDKFNELVPKYWNKNRLDTAAHAARKIQYDEWQKDPEGKIASLAESTAINYAGKGRKYCFGSPLDGSLGGGSLGYCEYTWAKVTNGDFERELTPQEKSIKDSLYKQFYGDVQDRDVFLMDLYDKGVLDETQIGTLIVKYYKKKMPFTEFKKVLSNTLGFDVEKCTLVTYYQEEEGFPEIPNRSSLGIDCLD